MRRELLALTFAGGLAGLLSHPASAITMAPEAGASLTLVTPVMTAAKRRRLYMMQSIQRQPAYGRGPGYGRPPGYGPPARNGYGAPPQGYGYSGPSRGGYYGY